MMKIKEYMMWCEEEGHTDENGDVVSMKWANEYMKTMEYEKEHRDYSQMLMKDLSPDWKAPVWDDKEVE